MFEVRSSMGTERRASMRLEIEHEEPCVLYKTDDNGIGTEFNGLIENISMEGMLLSTPGMKNVSFSVDDRMIFQCVNYHRLNA